MKRNIVNVFVLVVIALLMAGAMVDEDKILIPINQWFGLDSDESFAVDLSRPIDSWNIEIGNEGGKTFIQQRLGSQRVCLGEPATSFNAIKIIQIDGKPEAIIAAGSNGNIYETEGDGVWGNIDAVASAPFSNFTLFKDTVIYVSANDVYLFAFGAGTALSAAGDVQNSRFDYTGHFLHQDRIYGWGTADSNNCKIFWMPEFDIRFWVATMDSNAANGTSGFVYVDKDGGDFLTNVVPLGEHIMAYKSRSIYKILVSPISNVPVEIIRFAENVGAYGYYSVVAWNNIHFFVAEDGVYSNNGTSIQKISDPIDYWFRDSLVQSTGEAKVFKPCVYDNKLFVTLPIKEPGTAGDVGDYRTFVYDLDIKVWTKWKMAPIDISVGIGGFFGENQWMLRYEYSPNCSAPLTGANILKQRILFDRDSSGNVANDKLWMYPSRTGAYLSDGGTTFEASYTLPLSPITTMTRRKQIERVMVYGEATVAGSDSAKSNWVVWRNEDGDIDSNYFSTLATPYFKNMRVSPDVVGDLIGMRIAIRDTNRIKINAIEVVASEKGPADAD